MSARLDNAFKLTNEEHSGLFEKFANAFLVDDFPELSGVGGKHDEGMDARIFDLESGRNVLVVQSCVSPASKARTKILKTVKSLTENGIFPAHLIYCTPAKIGTALDLTRVELRKNNKINLEIFDLSTFCEKYQTSRNRALISENFANTILDPILKKIDPDRLYSQVLEKKEERIAVQYLEAANIDRVEKGSLTKGIFDSLIACVTRDSISSQRGYTEAQIIEKILSMFPAGHEPRIREIVPGRITHMTNKERLHFDKQAGGYVLSFKFKEQADSKIKKAQELEISFLAELKERIDQSLIDNEIDYKIETEEICDLGHQCLLWFLREEGRMFADPSIELLNFVSTEKLVGSYLDLPTSKEKWEGYQAAAMDLLPNALFHTLQSKNPEVERYLRAKNDLFIIHGFLQVTPDVQEACGKLLGGDLLYLDTTILIRCIAEQIDPQNGTQLLRTLQNAPKLNFQLKTWRCYVEELVSHLLGPVLLEWTNNFQKKSVIQAENQFRTSPTLIEVFMKSSEKNGSTFPRIVENIIGKTNHIENAIEFLREELGIITEEIDQTEIQYFPEKHEFFETWRRHKKTNKGMNIDRFNLLVKNDVDSCLSIFEKRKKTINAGVNHGHKIWLLTLDRLAWRMPKRMFAHSRDNLHDVAMSTSYLVNCVLTLANAGIGNIPEELLPTTSIFIETEHVPSELRAIYQKNWNPDEKKYLRDRKIRELTHQLKSGQTYLDFPVMIDEEI